MTTLGLTPEISTGSEEPRVAPHLEAVPPPYSARPNSVYEEQIQSLVQQLFFRQPAGVVRHVGFVSVETSHDNARLCLDVATALSEHGLHDVGLIDARLRSEPLPAQLQIPAGNRADASWLLAPRLWLAPRRKWLDDNARVWDPSLARLRTVTHEFDFSVLCFDPFSWLTARLSQACNGVAMVLTANQTRRLVASRMQEQLRRARVPILGTVLTERRFPVPAGLYRNL